MNNKTFTATATIKDGMENVKALMTDMDKLNSIRQAQVQKILRERVNEFVDENKDAFGKAMEYNEDSARSTITMLCDVFENAFKIGWNDCYKFHEEIIHKGLGI